VPADPVHNLHYIDGSLLWAAVIPMSLIGLARGYHVDVTPYLSELIMGRAGRSPFRC
jgi:hypothetical protein